MISENNSNSNRIMPYEETVLLSSHSNKRELFIKIQTYYSLFIVLLTGKKLHRRVNTLKFFSFKQRFQTIALSCKIGKETYSSCSRTVNDPNTAEQEHESGDQ